MRSPSRDPAEPLHEDLIDAYEAEEERIGREYAAAEALVVGTSPSAFASGRLSIGTHSTLRGVAVQATLPPRAPVLVVLRSRLAEAALAIYTRRHSARIRSFLIKKSARCLSALGKSQSYSHVLSYSSVLT